ncbi:MAG: hypothetical protein MPK62_01450 [Alphaproteobacteria bacterium]|nr:hypothetical protein [Alphaproteobacteria bacterium]MDA8029800.1 hypothetical protein [Alphaproteobacteria bacterium]
MLKRYSRRTIYAWRIKARLEGLASFRQDFESVKIDDYRFLVELNGFVDGTRFYKGRLSEAFHGFVHRYFYYEVGRPLLRIFKNYRICRECGYTYHFGKSNYCRHCRMYYDRDFMAPGTRIPASY